MKLFINFISTSDFHLVFKLHRTQNLILMLLILVCLIENKKFLIAFQRTINFKTEKSSVFPETTKAIRWCKQLVLPSLNTCESHLLA